MSFPHFLFSLLAFVQVGEPDAEWRFVEPNDMAQFYVTPPNALNPYRLRGFGDFNGDGIWDLVALKYRGDESALIVGMSQEDGSFQDIIVWRGAYEDIGGIGVDVKTRGAYPTLCGKGYEPCGEGEPAEFTVQTDFFEVFYMETSSAYYIWDGETFQMRWASE